MASGDFGDEPLYEPLHTIRLLRLPWGKDSSGFDGYLVSFALNSVTCPPFIALSYTWGSPPTYSKSININGHNFNVLDSLYPFLKLAPELKEFSSDTWWWIDSICINQKDEKEKSSQMEIMGKIYERADNTVVWLGEETDARFSEESKDCTGAIDNLYRLCDEMDAATRDNHLLDKKRLLLLREPASGVDWNAIERLLSRPWWRRVWTLQEFLISNHLRFYCGKSSISRRNLEDAIFTIRSCRGWDGQLMSRKAFYGAWNRRRMNQWYENRRKEMGLVAMMAYVGDCRATDERDRVYSLLGLAKDFKMIRPLDPNSTVEDVYTDLVRSFIKEYNNLDIICYSHLFSNSGSSTDAKKLPSWIPDWRARVEGKVTPVMASQGSTFGTGNFRPHVVRKSDAVYRASGKRPPQFKISDNSKVLTCTGIILDKIDGLGGLTQDDEWPATYGQCAADLHLVQPTAQHNIHSDSVVNSPSELMETLSRCLVLDRNDRYLAENISPNIFRADFEKYCRASLEIPDTVPRLFREWFSVNRSLIIQGRTLEDHCRTGPQLAMLTWKHFRHGSLKSFYGRAADTFLAMARRIAITETGLLGMAACRARKGDVVCVLYGCSIPVLLREGKEGRYEFIGECYVDGYMNGEALDRDRSLPEVEFQIV